MRLLARGGWSVYVEGGAYDNHYKADGGKMGEYEAEDRLIAHSTATEATAMRKTCGIWTGTSTTYSYASLVIDHNSAMKPQKSGNQTVHKSA